MKQTQIEAEQFLEWALTAPMAEVVAASDSLAMIIRVRNQYEAAPSPPIDLEPRRGRPVGSKNKPKEAGNAAIASE